MSNFAGKGGTLYLSRDGQEWVKFGNCENWELVVDAPTTVIENPLPKYINKTITVGGQFHYRSRELNRLFGVMLLWHRRN